MDIYQHRGIDIVVSQVYVDNGYKWLVTWKFPGEDEVISAYRESESLALGYAQKQIDQCLEANEAQP